MNEEKAKAIILGISECNWLMFRNTGEIVVDGEFSAEQLEALGWWFQRYGAWPDDKK